MIVFLLVYSVSVFVIQSTEFGRVEIESVDHVELNTTGQGSDWTSSFFGTQ